MPGAENKIWHGAPVWFLEGNPIVGYDKLKDSVRLLFWSGQGFKEKDLKKEGSFKASEIRYTDVSQINIPDLKRWLKKAKEIQWDYKNIVKRKGVLKKLPAPSSRPEILLTLQISHTPTLSSLHNTNNILTNWSM
jgi:hypothetical protein